MMMPKLLFRSLEHKLLEVAVYVANSNDVFHESDDVLSHQEKKKYNMFKTATSKREYFLGRYCAKQAYLQLSKSKHELKSIEIVNGIFEQPVLHDSKFNISISHSINVAGAVVFDKILEMGIDIETIVDDNIPTFKAVTLKEELGSFDIHNEFIFAVCWCLKESLSKAIKVGLTIPLPLLRIASIRKSKFGENLFECEFSNFQQYKGFAQLDCNYVVAIVYPKQLSIEVQS